MSVCKYSIKNTANAKAIRNDVTELAFVTSCKIKNGYIIVNVYDEAEEKSVFSNVKEIAQNYGAVVSRAEQASTSQNAKNVEKSLNSTVKAEISEEISAENDRENSVDTQPVVDDKEEPAEEEKTLEERKKAFKKESVSRLCELSLSLILLIVGYFLPGSNSSFGIKTAVYIIAFAISAYDVIYEIIKAVMKKRVISSSYVVVVLIASSVVFFGLSGGATVSFGYAFFIALKQFLTTKIQLEAEQVFQKGKAEEIFANTLDMLKNNKLVKIAYFISLVLAFGSFAFLFPQFREYNDAVVVASVSLILLTACEEVYRIILCYKAVKLHIAGVEFKTLASLEKLSEANAFELDASVLTKEGVLRQDAIGAMKELVSLNVKSLKTNFDTELSEDVRKQIDFKEKDFKGKRVVAVGFGKDVSFAACGDVTINNDDIKTLPYLFGAAKKLRRIKRLSVAVIAADVVLAVLSYVFCGLFALEYLSVICGALGYIVLSAYLAAGCFGD
ncbi:MAG: hypothetical protein ACI4M6_01870 [Christensenellaceae bacterium]